MQNYKDLILNSKPGLKDISEFIKVRELAESSMWGKAEIHRLKNAAISPVFLGKYIFIGDIYLTFLDQNKFPVPKGYISKDLWLNLESWLGCFEYIEDDCLKRII